MKKLNVCILICHMILIANSVIAQDKHPIYIVVANDDIRLKSFSFNDLTKVATIYFTVSANWQLYGLKQSMIYLAHEPKIYQGNSWAESRISIKELNRYKPIKIKQFTDRLSPDNIREFMKTHSLFLIIKNKSANFFEMYDVRYLDPFPIVEG